MSKVVSKLGVVEGGVYRHFKGKEYVVLGFVINSTNGGPGLTYNGEVFVRYRRLGGEAEFVRWESEFVGKTGKHWMNEEPRFVLVRMAVAEELRDVQLGVLLDRINSSCGKYLGDNDATCPQLTCIRRKNHEGLCDNVRGDDE